MVIVFSSFKFGVCLEGCGWGKRQKKKKRVGYNAVFDYYGQGRTKLGEKLFAKTDFFD